ncbi:Leucine rich repeat-containing protein [Butyrivibrio sp. INlla16]|nr:Leucine rich repeat-containing protein [Butyrivibrio sp. INlla16]
MRFMRRVGSLILCAAMVACLMPGVVARAATEVEVVVRDKNSEKTNDKAKLVFSEADAFDTYNELDTIEFRFWKLSEEDGMWYQEAKEHADEGYDLFALGCNLETFTSQKWTERYMTVRITFPIPDGYDSASLTRVFDYIEPPAYENADRVKAVSSTKNSSTIDVVLAARGNAGYYLTGEIFFQIKKTEDISGKKATLSATEFDYTGSPITPDVTIEGLVKDRDYTVTYKNNIEPGTATVTITGIGSYKGTIDLTFTIKQKQYKDEEVSDQESGADYEVNTEADGTTIATYKKSTDKKAKKISIPSEIKLPNGTTAKVTRIGAKAFKGSKAEQITIPSTVKKIDAKAFAGSSAKKIILKTDKKPNVSIGKGAFKNMKAKNITIQIKGCKGKEKAKLIKNVQKQSSKGTKVK